MSKFTKFCLIFCAIAVAGGMILSAIGFGMGAGRIVHHGFMNDGFDVVFSNGRLFGRGRDIDRDIDLIDDTTVFYDENSSKYYTDIKNLDVDLSYISFEIVETSDKEIKVEASGVYSDYKCYEENNTLVIENTKDIEWLNTNKRSYVTVYMPKGMQFDNVDLDIGAGKCNIDSIKASTVELTVGAGEIVVNNIDCDMLEADTGVGEMEVNGKVADYLSIECGIGNTIVNLLSSQDKYNYNVSSGIGNVSVGSRNFSGLGRETSNNSGADSNIDINCGIGNVEVSFDETM